jgi:phospholipid/cholesterol/gamma-HCH transport system substrate-binding protein
VRWLSRFVSVAVIVVIVGAVGLLIYSKVPETEIGEDFRLWVKFRDASRLAPGSPIVIAGVRVGDVEALGIDGQHARIEIKLQRGLAIPDDSFATRRSDSLFGDSYIEIIPGESTRLLPSGAQIPHVQEGGSTDTVLRSMARAMPKIDNALVLVHEFMVNGRKWVNGPMIETARAADKWLSEGHIEGPIQRADRAMAGVESGATAAADAVHAAVPDVARRLKSFDEGITSARGRMKEVKDGIKTALADTRAGLDRADEQIEQATEVMAAINEGKGDDWKGTLGTLVNDPELANSLEDFSASAAEGAAGWNRFRSWIGARVEANVYGRSFRVYATAELHARTDKFYLIEFEKSALGGFPEDSLTEVTGSDTYTRVQTIEDKLRFTAQFGKRIGFLQLRAGLKDSTPGVGADALFFGNSDYRRLRLSADLYGSFQPGVPRLKVAGALAVFRSLYILAGVDDALNEPGYLPIRTGNTDVPEHLSEVRYGRDYFVGASLHFDDADLATLLRVYGALIVGLAL